MTAARKKMNDPAAAAAAELAALDAKEWPVYQFNSEECDAIQTLLRIATEHPENQGATLTIAHRISARVRLHRMTQLASAPLQISLKASQALTMLASLQLGLRFPTLDHATRTNGWVAAKRMESTFLEAPAAMRIIEAGWTPENARPIN